MRSLRAEIGVLEEIRPARLPVEELLILAVKVPALFLRIVERVADVGGRVVPEGRALPVLAVTFAATRGPVQGSAVAGKDVDVGVNLAGDDHVADLVGLRYDVRVKGIKTFVDYCIEVRDFARQKNSFDECKETVTSFSAAARPDA